KKIKDMKEYTDRVRELQNFMKSTATRSRRGSSSETIEIENMQAVSDKQVYEQLAANEAKTFNSLFVDHLKIEMSSIGSIMTPVLQDSIDEAIMSLNFSDF